MEICRSKRAGNNCIGVYLKIKYSMLFQTKISNTPFSRWLLEDKENRLMLKCSLVAMIISFTWLKILYPYPNFMPPDSFSYLDAAYNNDFINIWAIGYSKFLRLISSFTNSHLVLVIVQYLMLQAGLLYLLFTIRYLFLPGVLLFRIIFGFCMINPLLPHIANFVSSDCLFTALSIVWYTQLLWIIYKPSQRLLIVHSIVLLFSFMVRHNALYYPIVSIAVVMFGAISLRLKGISVGLIIILICGFVSLTGYEYYKKTGQFQYSAFGGWQQAANSLYGYAYDKMDSTDKVPPRFKDLHTLVNQNVRIYKKIPPFLRPDREVGVFYLWDFQSPLRLFMDQKWKGDSTTEFFRKWASMAPIYGNYGKYLIANHPKSFIENYLWPNLQRYYAPPAQFMGSYNMGNKNVDSIAGKWFGWKSNVLPALGVKKIWIAEAFTIITPIVNVVFIAGFLAFIVLTGYKGNTLSYKRLINYTFVIWFANTLFSVLSAPIELRYQLFPLIISFVWALLFIGYIIKAISAQPEPSAEALGPQMTV